MGKTARLSAAALLFIAQLFGLAPKDSNGNATFENKIEGSGISYINRNSATPERHQIETMAGGVAVFDYNNDGLPDIYFTNGAPQPSLEKNDPQYFNRLYRNDGNWKFTDVTLEAEVQGKGFDIGVAAADYDNDGFTDLLVTSVDGVLLYRNLGNGRFEDVTARAGLTSRGWSVGAAWFDADNDGFLDLFLVRYVEWDPTTEPRCGEASANVTTYCHPRFYRPLMNQLFRNNGQGGFEDISESAGVARHRGKGMAAVIGDADNDGRLDIFVTNDTVPNFLFHNDGFGKFREAALLSGVGYNDAGEAVSSMGADFRDLNNDGLEDIVVTALMNETPPLFLNGMRGRFTDESYSTRFARGTRTRSGWGIGAFDFDNDGWKDLLIVNGDVQDNTELYSGQTSRQQNAVLMNTGGGKFEVHLFGAHAQHRGVAFGDFDRDGRIDAVVTALNGPPELLCNTTANKNHWLDIQLSGRRSNRNGIGAKVTLTTTDGVQTNRCTTAVGYASSSEALVHFGLGKSRAVQSIRIDWPSGLSQTVTPGSVDCVLRVEEPDSASKSLKNVSH